MRNYDCHSFHMIGNIYYVGTRQVSSHLFASKGGHILIDACMPDSGPSILKGIRALGFSPDDIRYLLVSHGHADHLGSAAFLAGETGAAICIGEADVMAAEKGSKTRAGLTGYKTFKVDRVLNEGDVIAVADNSIIIYHTPGHTPGSCSFGFDVQAQGQSYKGILFGGAGTNVFEKKNLERDIYGGTIDDFQKTLKRLLSFDIDVWLGNHPQQNKTFQKLEQLRRGASRNPYIDPDGWKDFIRANLAKAEGFLGKT